MSIGLAVVCLPWLRWAHPEWDRPIRVNLIWPILYTLATIFITVVPMVASPVETGKFIQGNLYTGKEVAELFIFKCASGGAGLLLQYDQRYLHQTFFTKYLGHFSKP